MENYQTAVDRYLDAVRDLRSRTPAARHSEYRRLLEQAEATRQSSEAARRALVGHMQKHGCHL